MFSKSKLEKIRLNENCADHFKSMNVNLLYYLLRLQEEFVYRFVMGIQGYYPNTFVEIEVEDEFMEDFLNEYPYNHEKKEGLFESSKREYENKNKIEIYTWRLDRIKAKELFSMFQNLNPVLDKSFFMFANSPSTKKFLNDKDSEELIHGNNEERELAFKRVKSNFIKGSLLPFEIHRIEVIFGMIEEMNFDMRLVFYKGVREYTKTGYLRLYFNYLYYNGFSVAHILPWDLKKKNQVRSKELREMKMDEEKKRKYDMNKEKREKILKKKKEEKEKINEENLKLKIQSLYERLERRKQMIDDEYLN